MDHRALLNLPSFRLDDFSFPSPLSTSPSCQSASSSCPSPSLAFYSSPSVCHSSLCIDETFLPAATHPITEFECVENFDDIFVEELGDLIDLKKLEDVKDAFASEDLGPEFWPPTHGVDNKNETPPSKGTIGEGVTVTNSQEDKDISCLRYSYPELDFHPPVPVHWVSSSSPHPLPGLVSPRELRTVSASVLGLHLANSAASPHCSSPSFSSSTFALDSPLTSDLTVSGSSEPHLCELQASDGDSVSTADRPDPAHTNDQEPQGSGTVVIQVESDSTNLDDGYVWRKYGEKNIKHRIHRRSYFRCANTGCSIRKKIERASEKYVLMTYIGRHNHYI